MMRLVSSRNSFLAPFGGPKEAQIDETSNSDDVKNDKSDNVDFAYPSLAKSLLLSFHGGQDGPSMAPGNNFYSA